MTDIVIRQSYHPRRIGGAVLSVIGLALTLSVTWFGLASVRSTADALIVAVGPAVLILGLWAAFPLRAAPVRMIISDSSLIMPGRKSDTAIAFDALQQVALSRPVLSKHERLTFTTTKGDHHFDVIHLPHEARDIINLISIRMEAQGTSLQEGRTEVLGAPSGIWQVTKGTPFEHGETRATLPHGREQNQTD